MTEFPNQDSHLGLIGALKALRTESKGLLGTYGHLVMINL